MNISLDLNTNEKEMNNQNINNGLTMSSDHIHEDFVNIPFKKRIFFLRIGMVLEIGCNC